MDCGHQQWGQLSFSLLQGGRLTFNNRKEENLLGIKMAELEPLSNSSHCPTVVANSVCGSVWVRNLPDSNKMAEIVWPAAAVLFAIPSLPANQG